MTITPTLNEIVRVITFEHIPLDPSRKARGRQRNSTHVRLNFAPFQHWQWDGTEWQIVGKSHWKGGLHNGHFSHDHGRLTPRLSDMIFKLVQRYAMRGNWRGYSYREDMEGKALLNLCENALLFNEHRAILTNTQPNPFAYYTTCITNCFKREIKHEKRHQTLRDDLLIQSGQAPSMTRQVDDYLAQFEPPKLVGKRGRPPKQK